MFAQKLEIHQASLAITVATRAARRLLGLNCMVRKYALSSASNIPQKGYNLRYGVGNDHTCRKGLRDLSYNPAGVYKPSDWHFASGETIRSKTIANVQRRTLLTANTADRRLTKPEYARIRLAFGRSSYFRELPAASLDRLAAVASLVYFRRASIVHRPGVPAHKLWLVLSGGLRVSMPSADGKDVTLAVIGEGSFYSDGSFVEGAFIETECRAERETTVAVINGRDMREIEATDADVKSMIPKFMLARIQSIISLFADAVSAPLPRRLARRLLSQALTSGRIGNSAEFELRVSQSYLVDMLGSSRSKVSAELQQLSRANIIRVGYRRLFICDFARLWEIAGPGVLPL